MINSSAPFEFRYILASCMYGTTPLAEILPEVAGAGSRHLDIWPRNHGNQREQVEEMGRAAFAALLQEHRVDLGISTRFDLGPFGLQEEMVFARDFGARILVCGSGGPAGLQGDELRRAVSHFADQLRPHVERAAELGIAIAIENHGHALIETPDSMKWLVEFTDSPHLGIALAPYHLPDDPPLLARLIEDLGPTLVHFYAWQHGMGCTEKLSKERELLQMPGRGTLYFVPLLAALKKIAYRGFTEIFMHPVPRGIPILEPTTAVTAEIGQACRYLEACLAQT